MPGRVRLGEPGGLILPGSTDMPGHARNRRRIITCGRCIARSYIFITTRGRMTSRNCRCNTTWGRHSTWNIKCNLAWGCRIVQDWRSVLAPRCLDTKNLVEHGWSSKQAGCLLLQQQRQHVERRSSTSDCYEHINIGDAHYIAHYITEMKQNNSTSLEADYNCTDINNLSNIDIDELTDIKLE